MFISTFSCFVVFALTCIPAQSQDHDFKRLEKMVREYTVILNMEVEYSFGMQTSEQEQRLLGTVVSKDGLIVFDGSFLQDQGEMMPMMNMSFRITPKRVEAVSLEGETYDAEYVGVDQYTGLGFARIKEYDSKTFKAVKFTTERRFKVGEYLALHYLLPEFVKPLLAADLGMVSALVTVPEEFALTVGFGSLEMGSVLFDKKLNPVGVLGALSNPSSDGADHSSFMGSFGESGMLLLGVITGEKIAELVAKPPEKGKIDRAWLGINLQALTSDIAEFLAADVPGGIIVNDVVAGSPAEECGLLVGDVIYEINGNPIEIDREEELSIFRRKIVNLGTGTSVEFSVLRPGTDNVDTLRLLAVLTTAPLAAADAEEYEVKDLEFDVRDLVFADYTNFNVDQGDLSGVVVSELQRGGPAEVGGLRLFDVIQQINGNTIASVTELEIAIETVRTDGQSEIILFVWRFGKTVFVNIKTDW